MVTFLAHRDNPAPISTPNQYSTRSLEHSNPTPTPTPPNWYRTASSLLQLDFHGRSGRVAGWTRIDDERGCVLCSCGDSFVSFSRGFGKVPCGLAGGGRVGYGWWVGVLRVLDFDIWVVGAWWSGCWAFPTRAGSRPSNAEAKSDQSFINSYLHTCFSAPS